MARLTAKTSTSVVLNRPLPTVVKRAWGAVLEDFSPQQVPSRPCPAGPAGLSAHALHPSVLCVSIHSPTQRFGGSWSLWKRKRAHVAAPVHRPISAAQPVSLGLPT
jgi:hypothetical protein